jgi:hypothetical protein
MHDPKNPQHDFGLVKVGLTRSDVYKRIDQLQTGNPFRIRRADHFWSPFARLVENQVHRAHASKGKQLEWLLFESSAIPDLVQMAKEQSERLAAIAKAVANWSSLESDGKSPRLATAEELKLRQEVRPVRDKLKLAQLRLINTSMSIKIEAGKVRRIPGMVETSRVAASPEFNAKKAFAAFRTLALQHQVSTVVGRFIWSGVRTNDSLHKTTLRTENGRQKILADALRELNVAMLQEWDGIQEEGKLTESLVRLHDSYLTLTEEVARLELDEYEIKARVIQMAERSDGIQGVCSYKRSSKLIFNRETFCEVFLKANDETELQKCYIESPPCINRRIFRSRSY